MLHGLNALAATFARLTALCLMLAAAVSMFGLAPEPDPVPRRWQLDVSMGELRMSAYRVGDKTQSFYFMTYKVTNNSGQDLLFAPSFEMAFGDGLPLRAGRGVPTEVTKAIIQRLDNKFIQDQINIIGPILQGPENAKEGVVIWQAENVKPQKLAVYAAGFSGETATIQIPNSEDKVILRKTLQLNYEIEGEMAGRGDKPIALSNQRWIMR